MSDTAMCLDHACPSRVKCYRYGAKPSFGRQTYGYFGRELDKKKCDYFIPVRVTAKPKGKQ